MNHATGDRPVSVYVHERACLSGEVTLCEKTSIWPGAVLRGDIAPITIGEGSNVQDNAVIHVSEGIPTVVGKYVTIGHGAILHGCTVGDGALIGMGAIVLDGAVIEENAMVAAGALVTPGTRIGAGQLAMGSPAREWRPLKPEEIEANRKNALEYIQLAFPGKGLSD